MSSTFDSTDELLQTTTVSFTCHNLEDITNANYNTSDKHNNNNRLQNKSKNNDNINNKGVTESVTDFPAPYSLPAPSIIISQNDIHDRRYNSTEIFQQNLTEIPIEASDVTKANITNGASTNSENEVINGRASPITIPDWTREVAKVCSDSQSNDNVDRLSSQEQPDQFRARAASDSGFVLPWHDKRLFPNPIAMLNFDQQAGKGHAPQKSHQPATRSVSFDPKTTKQRDPRSSLELGQKKSSDIGSSVKQPVSKTYSLQGNRCFLPPWINFCF